MVGTEIARIDLALAVLAAVCAGVVHQDANHITPPIKSHIIADTGVPKIIPFIHTLPIRLFYGWFGMKCGDGAMIIFVLTELQQSAHYNRIESEIA